MGETLVDIDGEEFNREVSFEYGVRNWEGREVRRLCFAYWLGSLLGLKRSICLSVYMSDKNLCSHIDHTEHLLDC